MEIQEKIEEGVKLISCDIISFGDYDNSCAVERANVRYLEEEKKVEQKETGCYGFEKVWLLDTPENRELLKGLENYPCFDDELVSEIESEIEEEYIRDNDDIWRNYTPEPLKSVIYELDMQTIDPEIYQKACDQENVYFVVESGGVGYIDLEKIAKTYNLLLCEKYPHIKTISTYLEKLQERPKFPFASFYNDCRDMLDHRRGQNSSYTQEETEEILRYAAELEELLEDMEI